MTFPVHFEGPAQTLFLREPKSLRILTFRGDEAVLPLSDFLAFLRHLTLHHAGALSLGNRAGRLAALIQQLKHDEDG